MWSFVSNDQTGRACPLPAGKDTQLNSGQRCRQIPDGNYRPAGGHRVRHRHQGRMRSPHLRRMQNTRGRVRRTPIRRRRRVRAAACDDLTPPRFTFGGFGPHHHIDVAGIHTLTPSGHLHSFYPARSPVNASVPRSPPHCPAVLLTAPQSSSLPRSPPHCPAVLQSRSRFGHRGHVRYPIYCTRGGDLRAPCSAVPTGRKFRGQQRPAMVVALDVQPPLLPPLAAVAATIASLSESKSSSVLDPSANVNLYRSMTRPHRQSKPIRRQSIRTNMEKGDCRAGHTFSRFPPSKACTHTLLGYSKEHPQRVSVSATTTEQARQRPDALCPRVPCCAVGGRATRNPPTPPNATLPVTAEGSVGWRGAASPEPDTRSRAPRSAAPALQVRECPPRAR
ncbi:hypothetical protein ABIE52_006916 [Rhodococcus sp. OAS809]